MEEHYSSELRLLPQEELAKYAFLVPVYDRPDIHVGVKFVPEFEGAVTSKIAFSGVAGSEGAYYIAASELLTNCHLFVSTLMLCHELFIDFDQDLITFEEAKRRLTQ